MKPLMDFTSEKIHNSSSKDEAEIMVEEILHTNNKITNECLDRHFLDKEAELIDGAQEIQEIPPSGGDTRTTLDHLSEIKSQYQEYKQVILDHHVSAEKVILDTSNQSIKAKYG